MKAKIHPKWYNNCTVTCACGNIFTTGSTLPEIKVEICSACHPFFTGKQKFIDTLGRVERFQQKRKKAKQLKIKNKKKKGKKSKTKEEQPKSLKEMLQK